MRQFVELGPNDGGTILLEVHETASATGPGTRDLCGGQVTERARQTFEDAVQRRTPAQAIITRLCGCPKPPDEVQVEFGLDLHAEVGAFIAAANFKTAMTWRRTQPPSVHG
jgi:hypothetical protein